MDVGYHARVGKAGDRTAAPRSRGNRLAATAEPGLGSGLGVACLLSTTDPPATRCPDRMDATGRTSSFTPSPILRPARRS